MAFHDAKYPLRPDRESMCRSLSLRGLSTNRTSDTPVASRCLVTPLTEDRRAFHSAKTAITALSVKKSSKRTIRGAFLR